MLPDDSPNIPAGDRALSPRGVADKLSCTERYVFKLVELGELHPFRLGKKYIRIPESQVDAFMTRQLAAEIQRQRDLVE